MRPPQVASHLIGLGGAVEKGPSWCPESGSCGQRRWRAVIIGAPQGTPNRIAHEYIPVTGFVRMGSHEELKAKERW